MKLDIDDPHYIIKLILNLFESMSFRFGMRANLPGVGAGPALHPLCQTFKKKRKKRKKAHV